MIRGHVLSFFILVLAITGCQAMVPQPPSEPMPATLAAQLPAPQSGGPTTVVVVIGEPSWCKPCQVVHTAWEHYPLPSPIRFTFISFEKRVSRSGHEARDWDEWQDGRRWAKLAHVSLNPGSQPAGIPQCLVWWSGLSRHFFHRFEVPQGPKK